MGEAARGYMLIIQKKKSQVEHRMKKIKKFREKLVRSRTTNFTIFSHKMSDNIDNQKKNLCIPTHTKSSFVGRSLFNSVIEGI